MTSYRRHLSRALVDVLAALALALPTAADASPRPATASPIQHVVVIYLENHTFDSVLGFWCLTNAARCPDGGMPAVVTLSNGAKVRPSVEPNVVPGVEHRTRDQVAAIDGGKMDGWQNIPGCQATTGYACVSGIMPSQEPNVTQLASSFAISDKTFSMQNSPSWFGHLYAVAASTDGFTGSNPAGGVQSAKGWGCDSGGGTALWSATPGGATTSQPSCVPDPGVTNPATGQVLPNGGADAPTLAQYTPTIMDRLNAASLSWKIYGAQCTQEIPDATGIDTCQQSNGAYIWSICPSFAECLYQQSGGLQPTQFIADAHSGSLPAFSVVTPDNFVNSWHNGASVITGDNWVGQLVSQVMKGPDWGSTAIFITWDDCGCFYDQVSPGVNPDGTPQGPRVPLLIVSPYAKPGYTDTTATTFAGILAYTEQTFGLAPLSVNDAGAYSFANAFDYSQTPLRSVPMVTRPVPYGEHIAWSQGSQDS